jgi:flagellar biosynthesis/type III secretory pathway chaperone
MKSERDQIAGSLSQLLEALERENKAIVKGRLGELEHCLAEKRRILEELSSKGSPSAGLHESDDGCGARDFFLQERLSDLKKKVLLANERNRLLLEDCSRIATRLHGLFMTALSSGQVYSPTGEVQLSPPTGRLLSGQF